VKTKIATVIITIIAIWSIIFLVDNSRCKNYKEPIFSIKVSTYNDGGSTKYVGVFYNCYKIKIPNPDTIFNEECSETCFTTNFVITPWFHDLEYAKNKVKKNK
jgi:hypothetical protein